MTVVYTYAKCSTCRKALNWLRERDITFEERPVREQPPSVEELRRVLAHYQGDLRRLFNTSGRDYRERNLKESLPEMKAEDALRLLAANGNLVKRPLLIAPTAVRAGFREEEWASIFS